MRYYSEHDYHTALAEQLEREYDRDAEAEAHWRAEQERLQAEEEWSDRMSDLEDANERWFRVGLFLCGFFGVTP